MPTSIITDNTSGGTHAGTEDSSIFGFLPDSNFGGSSPIEISADGFLIRALLRVTSLLPAVPAGSTITAVRIRLYREGGFLGGARSLSVYRCDRPWVESQTTWNNAATGLPWTTPGAQGAGDSQAVASATLAITNTSAYQTVASTAQLVADVQGWLNASTSGNGWLLAVDPPDGVWNPTSSEGTDGQRPIIEIDYTAPVLVRARPSRYRRRSRAQRSGNTSLANLFGITFLPGSLIYPLLSFPAASADATGTFSSALDSAGMAAAGAADDRGTFSSTLDGVAMAGAGLVDDRGTFASTLGGAVMASSGQVTDPGTFSSTLDGATMAASGIVGVALAGTFSSALDAVTLASAGQVADLGTFASTLAGASMAASGAVTVNPSGTFSSTLAAMLMSSTGQITLPGAFSSTLAGAALAASGTVAPQADGAFSSTLAGAAMSSSGFLGGAAPPGARQTQRLMVSLHI